MKNIKQSPMNHQVKNIYFLKNIRTREAKGLAELYDENDKQLLKYYSQQKNTESDNAILLQPEFYVERLAETIVRKKYLSPNKRKQYLINCDQDHFSDCNHVRLDGEYIYGLLPDNRLYVAKSDDEVTNHSHLVAGLPVIAVGHAYFKNGQLITLSNNSGHYKPNAECMVKGIEWFLKIINKSFIFEDHSKFSASQPHHGIKHYDAGELVRNITNGDNLEAMSYAQLCEAIDLHVSQIETEKENMNQLANSRESNASSVKQFNSCFDSESYSDSENEKESASGSGVEFESQADLREIQTRKRYLQYDDNEKKNLKNTAKSKETNYEVTINSFQDNHLSSLKSKSTDYSLRVESYTGLHKDINHSRFTKRKCQWTV